MKALENVDVEIGKCYVKAAWGEVKDCDEKEVCLFCYSYFEFK